MRDFADHEAVVTKRALQNIEGLIDYIELCDFSIAKLAAPVHFALGMASWLTSYVEDASSLAVAT